ncbi:MAG: hypothetical protein AAFR26_03450 [Cyanobacteria bacterium J06626_4]
MILKLQPHIGVGPILLGMRREEVRTLMSKAGYPLSFERQSLDYFFKSSIQTEYQADETVSFIGIASNQEINLEYLGVDLFSITAYDAFELISNLESRTHTYDDREYLFPDQIITLYDADPQYDHKEIVEQAVWGQIGLGDQRYLDLCTDLQG